MDTYMNRQFSLEKPGKMNVPLPSIFQIGDDVEVFLSNTDILLGTIYAVRFEGNGCVYYDIAVPAGEERWAIINSIRGDMRKAGTNDDPTRLVDAHMLEVDVRRSMMHVVKTDSPELQPAK